MHCGDVVFVCGDGDVCRVPIRKPKASLRKRERIVISMDLKEVVNFRLMLVRR